MSSFIVTVDRGYRKQVIMYITIKNGIGSVYVMPEHILGFHLFVRNSFMYPLKEYFQDLAKNPGAAG